MKILFITPSFSGGGAEKNMLNIINQLNTVDFDIHLMICTEQSSYVEQLNKSIKIYSLNKRNVKGSLLSIIKHINDIKPDIVFTSAPHLSTPILLYKKTIGARFVKLTRIPTLPSNKLAKRNIKSSILKFVNNKLLASSTYIIAQTPQMKEEIVDYYGVNSEQVVVINNIVDVDTIIRLANEDVHLPTGYCYIASGSLYSVKGFDVLIKAFAKHIVSFPTDKLLIIGREAIEKGYKSLLENLINKLMLNDNVSLLGHQSNPYKFYKNADAFVLSSLKEGFPNVVLENMVLGTPLLVTDCIDFTKFINSDIGIVVKRGSICELAEGLKNIRNYKRHQVNIKNFDFNKWFNEILDNENIASNK